MDLFQPKVGIMENEHYDHITQLEQDYFTGKPIWHYTPILLVQIIILVAGCELVKWGVGL